MADDVETIKNRVDLVDFVSQSVKLKKTGKNFRGLCPFHKENTPSFFVSPERQVWHCFGCQKGGDLFTFVMEQEGVEFRQALEYLADQTGITLSNRSRRQERKVDPLYRALKLAHQFYCQNLKRLPDSHQVKKYLREKREVPPKLIKTFELGYAPASWKKTGESLLKKGIKEEYLVKAGLMIKKRNQQRDRSWYDRFRDRLIFPIFDWRGKVVGFSARTLDTQTKTAKYINSPETPVFKKSQLLYGLPQAKEFIQRQDYVIAVEGQLDVIALHKISIKNVVAPLGTALTNQHFSSIKRLTKRVLLLFDQDEAGKTATRRSIQVGLRQNFQVKVARLSHGKDPDEAVKHSPQQLKEDLKNSLSFFEYLFEEAESSLDQQDPEYKVMAARSVLPAVKAIQSPIQQEAFLQKLSERLNFSPHSLVKEMENIQLEIEGPADQPKAAPRGKSKPTRNETLWKEYCAMLLQLPDFLEMDAQAVDIASQLPEPTQKSALTSLAQLISREFTRTGKVPHETLNQNLTKEQRQLADKLSLYELGRVVEKEDIFLENLEQIVRDIRVTQIKDQIKKLSQKKEPKGQTLKKLQTLTQKLRNLQ